MRQSSDIRRPGAPPAASRPIVDALTTQNIHAARERAHELTRRVGDRQIIGL
jgi:hypothetical protein